MKIKADNIFFDGDGNRIMTLRGILDLPAESDQVVFESPGYVAGADVISADFIGGFSFINMNVKIRFV